MISYSYSKEMSRDNFTLCELDLERIKKMFSKIFESYNRKVKSEVFDSFGEDVYDRAKEIHVSNERIWRMIMTDMLFNYDERGYLEAASTDNAIKRKQFAIIANVMTGKLRTKI